MKPRNMVLWGIGILVLLIVNYQIWQRELLAKNGRVILLQLAPVDPRSLIQGDYMRLRYALARDISDHTELERGQVVVQIDSNGVARYVRIYDSVTPLAENEILLPFRQSFSNVDIGPESFFFQEGHAEYYDNAKYGEFRMSESGSILLVGLRDDKLTPLGPLK